MCFDSGLMRCCGSSRLRVVFVFLVVETDRSGTVVRQGINVEPADGVINPYSPKSAIFSCNMFCAALKSMARSRGQTKTARTTVNLRPQEYATVLDLAHRQGVSVSWLLRQAIADLIVRQEVLIQPSLPRPGSIAAEPKKNEATEARMNRSVIYQRIECFRGSRKSRVLELWGILEMAWRLLRRQMSYPKL